MQELKIFNKNLKLLEAKAKKEGNDILKHVANEFITESEFSFEKQTSPFGQPWKNLAKSTLKRKKGSMKLVESGKLSQSLRYRVKDKEAIINTNIPYAPLHQFGGIAGKNHKAKIPARPFMPVDKNGNLASSFEGIIDKILNKMGNNLLKEL